MGMVVGMRFMEGLLEISIMTMFSSKSVTFRVLHYILSPLCTH